MVPRAVLLKSGIVNTARQKFSKTVVLVNTARQGNPQIDLQDKGVINSGCSRHMTENMSYLTYYEEIDEGCVAFGGNPKGEKITGKEIDEGCVAFGGNPKGEKITGKDRLGKFNGKADEEFFIRYSMNSKAFRVFNSRKRIVEENLHIRFSENTPNVIGTQFNGFACTKACENAGQARKEKEHVKDYILLPLWTADPPFSQDSKSSQDDGFQPSSDHRKQVDEDPRQESKCQDQEKEDNVNNTNTVNAVGTNEVNTVGIDYDEVFTPVARIEAIRLFLAFASFKDFVVYQMDVKSAFLYEKIEEDVYVCQPPRFKDPDFPDKLYKVEKALYGLHQAPRAWFTEVKNASTPMETQKPLLKDEDGFEQIVDFMKANLIHYALTVNSTVYTLCIEQFWATVKVKTIIGEVQLQALVDGKKVIITESTVRRDLQLEDTEGVNCLPNAAIFEQLTLMGYEKISQKLTFYKAFFFTQWKFLIYTILQCLSSKTTAWNNFSSTMTFAIICLATNQEFNFSKYIFESMVENLDNVNKLLTYPRKTQRKHTELPQTSGPTTNIEDEAVNEEMNESLARAATAASSLEAEQDSGTLIRPNPRQHLINLVLKELVQVVVPSAKKP
nr:ribonuclease H-like domain-containing protein [Tanacetum cinerariifolium]